MSTTNSPSHRVGTPSFDGSKVNFYDPDFTVEISNRMRVPDKISVLPEDELERQKDRLEGGKSGKGTADWMRVPDRIIVAGGDKHLEGHNMLPEMKLESSVLADDPFLTQTVQMMTPPRSIHLNQHPYPSIDESTPNQRQMAASLAVVKSASKEAVLKQQDLDVTTPEWYNSFNNSAIMTSDEANPIRRQLKSIARRVSALERDNQARSQRELILWTLGFVFFLYKGVSWFSRRPPTPW